MQTFSHVILRRACSHCWTGRHLVSNFGSRAIDRAALYYFLAMSVIGSISVYDAYLVRLYRASIHDYERNPLCLMLIRWEPQHLTYFFLAKAGGTCVVLVLLGMLYAWRRRLALPVVTGVVAFQLALLGFLNTGQ